MPAPAQGFRSRRPGAGARTATDVRGPSGHERHDPVAAPRPGPDGDQLAVRRTATVWVPWEACGRRTRTFTAASSARMRICTSA